MTPAQTLPATRPRMEGERAAEIYHAVIELLVGAGYDKLTFDAVATAARVGKATLYRRWRTKADLVLDAIHHSKVGWPTAPDTGSLRGDLLATACAAGGLCDRSPALIGALVPALHRDAELFQAFHERVLQPAQAEALLMLQRAQARGEVAADADLGLLAMSLPAICIHETVLFGRAMTPERVAHIVDQVVIPACRGKAGDHR